MKNPRSSPARRARLAESPPGDGGLRYLCFAVALALWIAGSAFAQPVIIPIIQSTVAALPAGASVNAVRMIVDGASADDCTTGGGSTYVWCVKTGAGWVAFGDGGGAGGSGDVTAVGNCSTGNCFQSTTATHVFAAPVGGGVASFRAITDADIPDTITIDLATLATTATTANAGDSATAFFGAGTLEHERGGLEADVSAFGGLVRISGGSTTAVSTLAGLNTALGSSIADGPHTTDTDTTCLDAGVDCLFAASATEGGAATSVTEGAVTAHEAALSITESQISDLAHTVDTDDQTATEVPYTPTTGADWTDPDPAHAGEGLDDLAARLTVEEAKADDDVPESGDFGAAVDLEADGSLSADVVAAAEMADADHGDVSWSGGVATVDSGAVGITELADDATCAANEVVARNAGDTAFECQAASSGSGDVVGPASSTTNAFALFADTTGKLLKNSTLTWDGSDLTLPAATQIQVPYGTDADPNIEWPNGTGIHGEFSAFALKIDVAGTAEFVFNRCTGATPCFGGISAGEWYMFGRPGTATVPNLGLNNDDAGFGVSAGGGIALIDESTTVASVDQNEFTIHVEQVNSPSAQTCTDNGTGAASSMTVTVSGTSNVEVTQNDASGGCAATLSETGATHGQILVVTNVSNAGGTLDFADTAGVQETDTGCSLGLYGVAVFRRITDRWLLENCRPSN